MATVAVHVPDTAPPPKKPPPQKSQTHFGAGVSEAPGDEKDRCKEKGRRVLSHGKPERKLEREIDRHTGSRGLEDEMSGEKAETKIFLLGEITCF